MPKKRFQKDQKKSTHRRKVSDPQQHDEKRRYQSPIPSREHIIDFLKKQKELLELAQIAKALHCPKKDEVSLEKRILAMVRDDQIKRVKKKFKLKGIHDLVQGRVKVTREGHGALTYKAQVIMIDRHYMQGILPDDEVSVRPVKRQDRWCAASCQLISREEHVLVGRIDHLQDQWYVDLFPNQVVSGRIWVKAFKEAKKDDYVYVKLETSERGRLKGAVVRVLGNMNTPGIERMVAVHVHGLPHTWSDASLDFVDNIEPFAFEDQREDWRKLPFVTIDGADAKDFDDAVYVEKKGDHWRLYVAIADVSHYVIPKTPLDQDAFKRATSVYFPREVIPMLPERLSNDLCSLRPREDRPVLGMIADIDAQGRVQSSSFHIAVIHSHARFTYHDVQRMSDGDLSTEDWFKRPLADLYDCYRVLQKCSKERGSLVFRRPEYGVSWSNDGRLEKIFLSKRLDSHLVIEQCMLVANEAAAKWMTKHHLSALYRVHPDPDLEKVQDLIEFLRPFGVRCPKAPWSHFDMQAVLDQIHTMEQGSFLELMVLRTMKQALYQPENTGHFGLALSHYVHFTSPIRRYPDLLVHRMIKAHLLGQSYTISHLNALGEHCSDAERRAELASRDVMDWLKTHYAKAHMDMVFEGVIISVKDFGLFVEIKDLLIEGLLHIRQLPGYFMFDAKGHKLVSRSGRCFAMGDTLSIRIRSVNIEMRHIDLELVESRS